MLRLNLVSQKLKEEIKLRHIYKLLLRINFVLVVATIFIAIINPIIPPINAPTIENNFKLILI